MIQIMNARTMLWRWGTLGVVAGWVLGCSGASAPDGSAAASNAGAATSNASAAQSAVVPPMPAMSTTASAAPIAPMPSASAIAEVAPPATSASAAAAPAEDAPIPKVKVKNIGIHIGGESNDDVSKEPIKRSVEPHFDAFRRCFAKVEDPKKGGDFGVDVLIEANGGKAKITHPRTALKGEGFEACVLEVFKAIEFLKPKGGKKTMVSYSIRFTP
jgi:hypothetical protein